MTPMATTQSRNGHLLGLLDRRSYFGGAIQLYGCVAAILGAGPSTTRIGQGAPFVLAVLLPIACIAAFRYAERDPAKLSRPGLAPAIQTLARLIGMGRGTLLPVLAGIALVVALAIASQWIPRGSFDAVLGQNGLAIGVLGIAGSSPIRLSLIGLPLVAFAARMSRRTLLLLALGSVASLGVLALGPIDPRSLAEISAPLLLGTLVGAGVRTRMSTRRAARVEEAVPPVLIREAGPRTRSAWRSVAIVGAMAIIVLLGDCHCVPTETGSLAAGGVGVAAVLATILLGAPATPLLVNRIGAPLLVLAIAAMRSEGGGLWRSLTYTIAALALAVEAVQLGYLGRLTPVRILTDLLVPGALLAVLFAGVSRFDATIDGWDSFVLSARGAAFAIGAVSGGLFRAEALVFVTGFVCKPLALLVVIVPAAFLQLVPLRNSSGSDRTWMSGILAGFVAPWLAIPIALSFLDAAKLVLSLLTAFSP